MYHIFREWMEWRSKFIPFPLKKSRHDVSSIMEKKKKQKTYKFWLVANASGAEHCVKS